MKDNRFLFGKRSKKKTWAPGVWDIVGGHAHKHEDVYEALKRETFEEVGIVVQRAELLVITNVWDESKNNFFEYHIYIITEWRGEPRNCSAEHTEIGWFTLNELNKKSLALPIYIKLIADAMDDPAIKKPEQVS